MTDTKLTFADRYPALTSRDFLIFWIGQFVSLIGTWMQSTTQPYLAYRLSGSRFDLGLIGFSATLPTLLLALPAGVIVERLDKRKTVIVMQTFMMVQAFMLAYLALTGQIQIWHLVALSFGLGVANAIEITARQAMLIELVGRSALPNAIALQATIFNAARVLGPMLFAPFLVAFHGGGEGWAFFANGVSFLFVIIGLFFVKTPFKAEQSAKSAEKRNFTEEFKAGQRYIFQNSVIAMIIVLAALLGFFGFPFGQQIPALARDVLKTVAETEANVASRTSLLYAFQGVGALIAAFSLASFHGLKRKGLVMVIGQFTFIAALIVISFIRNTPLALIFILILGWGMVTQLNLMNTLIQINVPDNLRGRVFSTYLWALQGVAPFGSLVIGWMAQNWGIPNTALACGLICLVGAGWVHLSNPAVRKMTA